MAFDFNAVPRHGLRSAALRGVSSTLISQVARQALMLAGTMIVARHVTPVDFGLVAMVTAPLTLLEVLRECGLMTVCVQTPRLDHETVNGLFWVNALAGAAVFALVCLGAPWFSLFYQQALITPIAITLAAGLLAASLSIQHYALLRREMRFTELAALELVSTAVSVAIGILAALAGWGFRAILAQILANRLVNVIGAWLLCAWRPSFAWGGARVGALVRNGAHLAGNSLLVGLSRGLDAVVLARTAGADAVGFYSRGLSISLLPVGLLEGPLSTISVSALSNLQSDPARRDQAVLFYLRSLTAVMCGLALVLALAPDLIVAVILGSQWAAVVPLLRWLALLSVALPLGNGAVVIATAYGCYARLLRCSLMTVPVVLAAVVWGAWGGAHRLVIAYSTASLAAALFLLVVMLRYAFADRLVVWHHAGAVLLAALIAWAAGMAAGGLAAWPEPYGSLLKTVVGEGLYLAWAGWYLDLPSRIRGFLLQRKGRPV